MKDFYKPVASIRCAHPLKAFRVGYNPSGKIKYKVTSFDTYGLIKIDDDKYVRVSEARAKKYPQSHIITEYIEIPCGHCIFCHLRYSKNWADRCLLEAKYHKHNWFLTLTYNDNKVPTHECVDKETGELFSVHSLRLRDVQLFLKRLRKAYPECKIRYFLAGEYGERTYRPHYHMIAFGLEIDDLEIYKRAGNTVYYRSNKIDRVWDNGNVLIGHADWSAIAYTARYITKKAYGAHKDIYEDFGISREFCTMSRKPGIGLQYYLDNPDCLDKDFITVSTLDGGKKFRPPRYFKRKYDQLWEKECPELYAAKKESDYVDTLEAQREIRDFLSAQSDLSYLELLQAQEENKRKGIDLKRSAI